MASQQWIVLCSSVFFIFFTHSSTESAAAQLLLRVTYNLAVHTLSVYAQKHSSFFCSFFNFLKKFRPNCTHLAYHTLSHSTVSTIYIYFMIWCNMYTESTRRVRYTLCICAQIYDTLVYTHREREESVQKVLCCWCCRFVVVRWMSRWMSLCYSLCVCIRRNSSYCYFLIFFF